MVKKIVFFISMIMFICPLFSLYASDKTDKREKELQELQEHFQWWPTDAQPCPVKDGKQGGYWWWPKTPGKIKPWGNRGYIYVHKIIFDFKEEELPPPQPQELRPSLLIKRIHKNVKVYFDYNSSLLRPDAKILLKEAVNILKKNTDADILITGSCDIRGSEAYNMQLGKTRAASVSRFMFDHGVFQNRVRIISRGKLDAVAPVTDIIGMQKDRNIHFVIAEVEEIMIPYPENMEKIEAEPIAEGKYLIEKEENIESEIKVSTRQYTIKKEDTLWKIAEEQLGSGHRWKYLYEMNKDKIKNPDKLSAGVTIIIPVEQGTILNPSSENVCLDDWTKAESVSRNSVREYIVKKNDSLWKIAQRELGNGNRWKEIYELNKEKIIPPDKISAGITLILPDK